MPQFLSLVISFALLSGLGTERLEIRDSTEIEPAAQTTRQIKWPKRTIEVTFSNSLLTPGSNIKPGSDVVGAARRALLRWSSMTNINFVVNWSTATSVSPASSGDGISLITVATTFENEAFNSDSNTGRTRVFFNPDTGAIAEADIAINPRPRSADGADLQFSTDGTPGTYDLEATFTHEIGHLLGLDHSSMLASTMQSRQAFNGTFGLPALTERTLSEDDRQRVRSIYGPKQRMGRIEGRLIDNRAPNSFAPLEAVSVWAESVATGRVIASGVSDAEGNYRLEGLPAGQYRVVAGPRDDGLASDSTAALRGFEIASQAAVKNDLPTTLNYNLVPPHTLAPALTPRMIGLNSELSSVPLPLEPGKKVKVFLGGEGIDQVPGSSIVVNSPYFTVDAASLTREQLGTKFPVVSVEVTVSPNAPFGDYTIKLQSNSGEIAFVPGALTIDPGVASTAANPLDDFRFFISQHYSDLTGRDVDAATLDKLTAQLSQCGTRLECLKSRKLDLSTNLLNQNVASETGIFLYALYHAGLGRRPRLNEFESDRKAIVTHPSDGDAGRIALALAFVQRSEFEKRFPNSLNASGFVEQLSTAITQSTGIDLKEQRTALLEIYDGTPQSRAAILNRIASHPGIVDAHFNHAFVTLQYFSFLRRDPDETGLNFWANVLKNKPLRDSEATRSMVCTFLNSTEYQSRFGMAPTQGLGDCN